MIDEIKSILKSYCDEDITIEIDKYPLYNTSNIHIVIKDNKHGCKWKVVTNISIDDTINIYDNKHIKLEQFKRLLEQYVKAAKIYFNKVIDYEKGKIKQD